METSLVSSFNEVRKGAIAVKHVFYEPLPHLTQTLLVEILSRQAASDSF